MARQNLLTAKQRKRVGQRLFSGYFCICRCTSCIQLMKERHFVVICPAMFCSSCGSVVDQSDNFCTSCGKGRFLIIKRTRNERHAIRHCYTISTTACSGIISNYPVMDSLWSYLFPCYHQVIYYIFTGQLHIVK